MRSGALNVVAIDPETESAPSVVIESAPASTSPRPLGGVAPPDQVIEARLALTVLTLKSVKVSVPEGTVSTCVLPVVLMASMTVEKPASGASTGVTIVTTGGCLSSGTSITPGLTAVICVSGDSFRSARHWRRTKLIGWSCTGISNRRRARSARRRALLAQRKRRKRALLGLLQFRHPRSRIRETGHGPCRVDDDCFSRGHQP